jgi:hypothetical protein
MRERPWLSAETDQQGGRPANAANFADLLAGSLLGAAATDRCRTGDRYAENSVPVALRLNIELRSCRIAAVAIKVIAALKTAERPRLALLNAEMEPRTI